MTLIRIISAVFLAGALGACGGQYDIDPSISLASTTAVSTSSAQPLAPAATVAAPPISNLASATMPAPDCASEGCARLRIIDGNAEAWRIDAQRRAAQEAGQPLS